MHNSLENYLEAAGDASKVLAHAKLLVKLTHLYQEIAPAHLGQASSLANYKSGIIVIHATSSAIAAKLRQLAPTLTDCFSKKGIECNGVQVKVQAGKIATQSRTSTIKPLSPGACSALEDQQNTLPDSTLRSALATMLARSARQE